MIQNLKITYRLIIRIQSKTGGVYLITRQPIYAVRPGIIDQPHCWCRHRQLFRYSSCIINVNECWARRIGTSMLDIVYRFQLEESGNAIIQRRKRLRNALQVFTTKTKQSPILIPIMSKYNKPEVIFEGFKSQLCAQGGIEQTPLFNSIWHLII